MAVSSKVQKVVKDLFYNIFSYGLSIILLQFLILPLMARQWTEEYYGTVLLLTSIINIAVAMTAVTIANTRLIVNEQYKAENLVGDFNRILCSFICVGIVFLAPVFLLVLKQGVLDTIFLLIYYTLYAIATYLAVGFKLNCNFKMVMCNNIILCTGYLIGIGIFFVLKKWQFIYITGVGCAALHAYFTTNIRKESFKKTKYYKETLKRIITLDSSEIMGTGLSYYDRFCLYPLIGGAAVANYQVASTFGKALNLLLTPINMVILSYLSKKNTFSKKTVYKLVLFLVIIGSMFLGFTKLLSEFILRILYPKYVDKVMEIVPLVTLAMVVLVCSSLLRVFALRYASGKEILRNEVFYSVLYVISGILFLIAGAGLTGFCIASLLSATFRFLIYVRSLIKISNNMEREKQTGV